MKKFAIDDFIRRDHDHDGTYSILTHNHDGVYSSVSHNHDQTYASLSHDHDLTYAPLNHDHDQTYASLSHDHDQTYATLGHDHDQTYATLNHDHDQTYAPLSHNHDGVYALSVHNHDSVYPRMYTGNAYNGGSYRGAWSTVGPINPSHYYIAQNGNTVTIALGAPKIHLTTSEDPIIIDLYGLPIDGAGASIYTVWANEIPCAMNLFYIYPYITLSIYNGQLGNPWPNNTEVALMQFSITYGTSTPSTIYTLP